MRQWLALGLVVLALGSLRFGAPLMVQAALWQSAWEGASEPVALCRFKSRTGVPCAGCGGTRALRLASEGRFGEAFSANPLGAWVGLELWAVALLGGVGILRGGGTRASYGRWALVLLGSAGAAFVVNLVLWWQRLPAGLVAN